MVKDDTLKNIASRSGIDVSDDTKFTAFKEALTSDTEAEVTMPEKWHTFSDDVLTSRDKNKYDEGKVAGIEMEIKQFKTDNKLEFEGKSVGKLVEHVKTVAVKDAGKEPEAKYKELETKYTGIVNERDTLKTNIEQKDKDLLNVGLRSDLVTAITSKGIDTTITANEISDLFFLKHSIEEGKHAKINGTTDIIRDDKTNGGVPWVDVGLEFANKFAGKKKIDISGGGNGKDGKEKRFTTMDEYTKWKESEKPTEEIASEVLIESAKAVGQDFYKD
ncbi:hypothetical protein KAR91_38990 [Candidatus Pacearchaeota archaeon]|nr:hypothetical protein [Candidatus Pacearchaeota archaeon]